MSPQRLLGGHHLDSHTCMAYLVRIDRLLHTCMYMQFELSWYLQRSTRGGSTLKNCNDVHSCQQEQEHEESPCASGQLVDVAQHKHARHSSTLELSSIIVCIK